MSARGPLTLWDPDTGTPELAVTAPAHAWLAVAVAAAGGHHLSLTGATGTGKTLLANALHRLLPGQTAHAARQRHRLARPASRSAPLTPPPWQAPHHTCSIVSLTGSLTGDGALGLAHQGVLFLDDAAEYPARHLDAITTAISRCETVIAQAGNLRKIPCCAQLVLASRPCDCTGTVQCGCSRAALRDYRWRTVRLRRLADLDISLDTATGGCDGYGLASGPLQAVAHLVARARRRRTRRPLDLGPWVTSHADYPALLHPAWAIPGDATQRLRELVERADISVTSATAVRRVAWTLADLAGRQHPEIRDIDTALALHRPVC